MGTELPAGQSALFGHALWRSVKTRRGSSWCHSDCLSLLGAIRVDLTPGHGPTERSDPPPRDPSETQIKSPQRRQALQKSQPSIRGARHGKVELAQSADLGNVCHIEIGDLVLSSLTTTNHGVFEPSRDSTIFTDARHR